MIKYIVEIVCRLFHLILIARKLQWFEWAYAKETVTVFKFLEYYTAPFCTVRWSWELKGAMSTDTVFELNSYPRDDGHLHQIGT
jgi:hypothetical protein